MDPSGLARVNRSSDVPSLSPWGITIGLIAQKVLTFLGIKTAAGTSSDPAWAFSANKFDGIYWLSVGHLIVTANGNPSIDLAFNPTFRGDASLRFAPDGALANAIAGNTCDAGWKRDRDGVIRFTRADLGANGTIAIGDPGYARPAAAVGLRGAIWIEFKGAGVADTVSICVKNAADAYVWQTLI